MGKAYLTLQTTHNISNPSHKLFFSRELPIKPPDDVIALERTSPVFCINDNPLIDYVNFKSGRVILLYTIDPYNLIRVINQQMTKSSFNVFVTQGIASVFLLGDSSFDTDYIIDFLKTKHVNIIGTELWEVSDGNIISQSSELPKYNRKATALTIDESKLTIDDVFLFQELVASYNHFDLLCDTYIPQYKKLSDSIRYSIVEMYDRMSDILSNNLLGSIEDSIIREEVLETTATLKTINVQAFNGIGILSSNLARSGRYSLFGIGLCYAGMYQLYEFCREKFQRLLPNANKFKNFIDTAKPPSQNSKDSFNDWYKEINQKTDIVSIDNLYNQLTTENKIEHLHLPYFSHRYGFREAKTAISIAKQSISLSILPTWGLNTFFHELLHSHVRVLLSEIDFTDSQTVLNPIAENEINIYSNNAESLKQFLQIAIFDCVKNYRCIKDRRGKIQSILNQSILIECLRHCYERINEIMVHTLDFHYFYNSDADLYIKSIWISWLKLPATDGRIPEYLLRTICAIGTLDLDKKLDSVFDTALNKIETNIDDLRNSNLCNEPQIDTVINCIQEIRNNTEVKKEYIDVWGRIAYITYKFLYSKQVQASFEFSMETESQNFEDYNLNLKIGEYNSVKYKNPIKIIQQILSLFFNEYNSQDITSDSVEVDSLWIYNILSSTKFNNNGTGNYQQL
jgi:hypothetical protein